MNVGAAGQNRKICWGGWHPVAGRPERCIARVNMHDPATIPSGVGMFCVYKEFHTTPAIWHPGLTHKVSCAKFVRPIDITTYFWPLISWALAGLCVCGWVGYLSGRAHTLKNIVKAERGGQIWLQIIRLQSVLMPRISRVVYLDNPTPFCPNFRKYTKYYMHPLELCTFTPFLERYMVS